MGEHIPSEYFELIRDVLRKRPREETRPLKRKRKKNTKANQVGERSSIEAPVILDSSGEESKDVINLDSDDDENDKANRDENDQEEDYEEEDYESEEFEDVDRVVLPRGDVSVTIDKNTQRDNAKTKNTKRTNVERNVCSNEERKYRREMHCLYLLCLVAHGHVVNHWLNNSKMNEKLSNLVPDKVFQLLHPTKDDEMPLRSTRKLLDGLKKAMELWQKHWKITRRYEGYTCYMRYWDELKGCSKLSKTLTKTEYIKNILKGVGNKDLATQGFVALLRSCNVNARLVLSCQPPDFTNLKQKFGSEKKVSYEDMTKYPVFWCEVWDKFGKKWITIDPMCLKTIEQVRYSSKLEPKGAGPSKRNILRYVIGYDRKEGCRDITRRYAQWYNSKTRKKRITKDTSGMMWFEKLLKAFHKRKRTKIDDFENDYFEDRNESEAMPDNMQDFKNHPYYILEKDLRQNQVLKAGCKECGYLKLHNKANQVLKVFHKRDLLDLKTARQWYMEGRILKTRARSLKTVTKKSFRPTQPGEEEEEERLYQFDDTELYVPPLATRSGEIETNTFGNIEVFVPSMIPQNCCLIESPVAVKAASFIKVKFAKAVTSFKFEKGKTVKPSITGVVVALWYRDAVVEAINGLVQAQEEEKAAEHELEALRGWHSLLTKLRIKKKLNTEYGKVSDETSGPVISQHRIKNRFDEDVEYSPTGGFLISDIQYDKDAAREDEEEVQDEDEDDMRVGGFIPRTENEDEDDLQAGGFLPQTANDETEGSFTEENNDEVGGGFLPPHIYSHDNDNIDSPGEHGGFIADKKIDQDDLSKNQGSQDIDDTEAHDIQDQDAHLDEDYKDFMDELDISDED
ncbi:DNA repair protein RAD4 [Nakaseomyces bracarensis]|uniref:DNA repair protein RAD4 n=1 Tax=Nakaseomyces bracarensis TaxID=273131 RepID=A0ABR4NXH9_9SACH